MKATVLLFSTLSLIFITSPIAVTGDPTLELDSTYSPPASIPTDPALMYYNSPEMDHMLEPIKVKVLDDNGNLITEPITVIATTILSTNWDQPDNSGDTYTGTLCQHTKWSSRFGTCRFRFDDCIEMTCNTTDPNYPLGKVEVESVDGVASFERLLHTMYSGMDQRRVRFFADINGTLINVTSNAFDVTLAAAKLEITSGTQANVLVNEPMTFTVRTMAVDPADPNNYIALTTGRHSILNVDLTIAYDYKQFYIFFPSGNFNFHQLASSTYTLGGADVMENGYYDLVIRKQCSAGVATFTDVRILTEAADIQLNFTQTLPYHPWERWPPVYNESWVLDWTTWTQKTYVSDSLYSPAVAFTNAFNVTLPTMNSLTIEATSLANFLAQADANFPFKTPLLIQALDSNNRVITDGPDSTLEISVEITPGTTCLSIDSNFTLTNGEGVFTGSICEVAASVSLRFFTTDSQNAVHYTASTPAITVSGEFRVAGIFPIFADVTTDLFTAAAVELVNEGVWEPDFKNSGRSMVCQYYFVQSSDVQNTLQIYDNIYALNTDAADGKSIRTVIGSATEEDTIALSTVSKRHEMPIMGYVAESGELSDKTAHPYFNRVSYSEGARYYSEGAYMASHHWDKVIVIKDSSHPIPTEMYNGFEAHGVKISLEATIPTLSTEPSASDLANLPHLHDIARQILNAGTRLIYTYTHSPTDIYLYEEAIFHGFAPIDGFQWMGNSLVLSSFPLTNGRGNCLTLTPTCTSAFNSTINMAPTVIPDLWSGYWGDHLYYTLTNLDPTLLPGSTIYRWPEVLGAHSKGHDAVVAIIKGAMTIINDQETITGTKLAQMIRTVNFTGGTGYVSFDANGDRPGYSASVFNFNPVSDPPSAVNDVVWTAAEWTIDPISLEVNERQFSTRTLGDNSIADASFSYPPISYFNQRNVEGYVPGSSVLEPLVYDVPAVYWCSQGCGGGLAPYTNGTIYYYNYGTCEAQDMCVCKNKPGQSEPGYAGSACQQILCDPQCRNGECVQPDVCECEPYWTGNDCGTPQCTVSGCNADTGNCTGPNICTCISGHWGTDCAQRCTCQNGVCNDGQGGTGTCSVCDSGYTGSNCELSIPLVVVPTIVIITAAIIIIVVVTIWYIKRMKFRAALANNDWIVTYADVVIATEEAGANSMAFRSMVSLHADQQRQKNVVRNQGKWNGAEVAIKMLDKESVIANTQQRLEIKAMRDIRHNNLASFVGACCDTPNVCILMETAPKGSLDDILSMGTLQLDWNFKYSLLKDICRGMAYLAGTPIKSHGRLKSSNCVIDNRWTLKITDYGMHLFKSNQNGVPKFNPAQGVATNLKGLEEGIENSIKAALLYTAPEFLRQGVCHPDHVGAGTIQGDMYSLGIIMSEVLTVDTPFYELLDYVEVQDVLDAIAGRVSIKKLLPQSWNKNTDLVRPTIPEDTDPKFAKLLYSTWVEDPMQRPTFQQVLKELNSISPQKGDLMDNLVNMLEKYSTNLEAVVAERTQELAAEKAKTDELVCRMLPRAIAEQLLRGETVSAESFECVTIYFSDIVGFTKIAGGSTPLQVVDLLNDLYTCFDAIIDHFDVYKVETIGDAYMVVSGLPIRNGDQHAGEIASMSLHLLSAIMDFRIRHMPEERLQLRIGIHSGPVVAGVVGLKMPRYCLFGDTVNTASRMESGGFALKIHMSDSTTALLEKLGGYHIQKRGEREVKGKGVMTTYWLKNMDGFNRPLPSDDMAASESQHEFK